MGKGQQPPIDTRTIEAAAGAINDEEESDGSRPATVTCSNGLVLRVKAVPPYLIQRAAQRITAPKVPKVWMEDKGREEENPADPAYQEALVEYTLLTADAGANVMLGAGTTIEELGPDMEGPDGDEWMETLAYFGVEFDPANRMSRYITWLTCYALPTAGDLQKVVTAVARRTGVSEGEVSDALTAFRDREARGANNGLSAEAT